MKVLSREQLLLLHSQLINRYGGTHGVQDEGLLDSALNAPFQGFGDYEFYPTVTDKAVRLGYGLIENHPFHAGNKCIGACPRYANLA
jgi:death-on-curing protein